MSAVVDSLVSVLAILTLTGLAILTVDHRHGGRSVGLVSPTGSAKPSALYCQMNGGDHRQWCTRIEFRYIDEVE